MATLPPTERAEMMLLLRTIASKVQQDDPHPADTSRIVAAESVAQKSQTKLERMRLWVAVLLPAASVTIGALGWMVSKLREDAVADEAKILREQTVDGKIRHLEKDTTKLQKIGIEHQIQLIEGFDYLGKKIDAVQRGDTRTVKVPVSLDQGKRKVERIRAQQTIDRRLEDDAAETE